MDPIETDLAHGLPYAMHLLPTYSWTRDSTTIVLSQGGRIRRLRVSDGTVQTIPFRARVHRQISQSTYVTRRAPSGPVTSRFVRWPATSPDGASVAFEAFGQVWVSTGGRTAPLLPDHKLGLELSPAWSPDGRWIAFATWAEGVGGHIWRVLSDRTAPPERLTRKPGEYLNPVWADERTLIFARGSGATFRGKSWSDNAYYDIVSMPSNGGDERVLARAQDQQLGQVVRPSVGQGRVVLREPAPARAVAIAARVGPPRWIRSARAHPLSVCGRCRGIRGRVQRRVRRRGARACGPTAAWNDGSGDGAGKRQERGGIP